MSSPVHVVPDLDSINLTQTHTDQKRSKFKTLKHLDKVKWWNKFSMLDILTIPYVNNLYIHKQQTIKQILDKTISQKRIQVS